MRESAPRCRSRQGHEEQGAPRWRRTRAVVTPFVALVVLCIAQRSFTWPSRARAPSARFRQDGSSAVHVAAYGGHDDALQALLEAGADATATNNAGVGPLSAACMNSHPRCARMLLAKGAPADAADEAREKEVPGAVAFGKCSAPWSKGGRETDTPCHPCVRPPLSAQDGNTCLHYAAAQGSLECLRAVREAQPAADVNAENNEGWTPLHFAALRGRDAAVEALLAAGAAKDALTEIVRTPAAPDVPVPWVKHPPGPPRCAAPPFCWSLLVLQFALTLCRRWPPSLPMPQPPAEVFHAAVHRFRVRTRSLCAGAAGRRGGQGEQDHHRARESRRARAHAVLGSLRLVNKKRFSGYRLCGATPLLQTGSTPLHTAAGRGHTAVVELLLTSGANKEALRDDGWRPLASAAFAGHSGAVKALLDAGADREAAGPVRSAHTGARESSGDGPARRVVLFARCIGLFSRSWTDSGALAFNPFSRAGTGRSLWRHRRAGRLPSPRSSSRGRT